MAAQPTCRDCGGELTGPRGHCPRCLLKAGLEGDSLSMGTGGALGITMSLGTDAAAWMLADLAASVGPVPRVLLRDTDSGPEPPARPGSDTMPAPIDRGGPLQILGEIARGGMGAVLKGRDADLGRDLAVKVLLERHRDDPEMLRRFVEEAQIAGQLQHPGIVPVYQLGAFADRRPFFTMKLVKGRTLAEILRDRPGPGHDLPQLLSIFLQVAQTIAYAHARGVIHRDLKPSNVMVGAFGEVQVMDWGLAKVLPRGGAVDDATAGRRDDSGTVIATARVGEDEGDRSRAGSVLGTPAYMAPEQARGEIDRLDERCDVFALGSILCEVLTGEPAFSGRTSGEIQRKAARGETAEALTRLRACGADPGLLGLAVACLASEVEDRPRDAGAVTERLSAHLAGVQDRLRAAELAQAAEVARTQEAVKSAEAAEARARAERQTAEEAVARAKAERRARRLTAALAACVVAVVALGSGGFAWSQRQRAERRARATAAVHAALAEAARLAGEARSEPGGASTRWAEAVAQARRADDLARQGETDVTIRRRAAEAFARVGRERAEADRLARRAEGRRGLLDRLAEARTRQAGSFAGQSDAGDTAAVEEAYAAAYRQAGLDPEGRPAEAGAAIRAFPPDEARAAAAALDDWASIRRMGGGASRLIEAASAADPDPWRNALRAALSLPEKAPRLAELRRLSGTTQLGELSPVSLDLLGRALGDDGDLPAAESVLREAQHRHPGDLWINYDLGQVFERQLKREEAIRCYYAARAIRPEIGLALAEALFWKRDYDEEFAVLRGMARLRPDDGRPYFRLYGALGRRGRGAEATEALDAAIAADREAIRRRPNDAAAHVSLGNDLVFRKQYPEAEAAYRQAIRLSPSYAVPHETLSYLYSFQGRYAEAEASAREAIRLRPNNAGALISLGSILRFQARYAEAVAAYREAIRLRPDYGSIHSQLARCHWGRDEPAEAEASYRQAIRHMLDQAMARGDLARCLERQGKMAEAEAEAREAVRVEPDSANSYFVLGLILQRLGKLDEALASFRTAVELLKVGEKRQLSTPRHVIDSIVNADRRAERQAALGPRLAALLTGDDRPKDAAEGLDLAGICFDRSLNAAAARHFADALAADPKLVEDRKLIPQGSLGPRDEAARAAAAAGTGKGRDDPPPDGEARTRLRRQALDWLAAELAARAKELDSGDASAREMARTGLATLRLSPDLAGVREPEALAALPEAERAEWRAFWAEVDALQKRVGTPVP